MKKVLATIIVGLGILCVVALLIDAFIIRPVLVTSFVGVPVFMALFFWALNFLYDDWVSKEP